MAGCEAFQAAPRQRVLGVDRDHALKRLALLGARLGHRRECQPDARLIGLLRRKHA
jgi:hypothetical protein